MTVLDIVILLGVAVWAVVAVKRGCGGDCSGCTGGCEKKENKP